MPTFLIGTEAGEGMGHVAKWLDVCAQATQEGHTVHMAGPDVRVLYQCISSRSLPVTVWAGPCVQPLPDHPPPRSWPALLVSLGYAQAPWLTGAALAWAAILDSVQPDAVLCDYAPALMLACQALGVRYLEAGGGFCVPPISKEGSMPPFPGVQHAQQDTTNGSLNSLSEALRIASRVLKSDQSRAAATAWCDLHIHAAHRLVSSPSWLDHYELRDPQVAPVEYLGFMGLRRESSDMLGVDPGCSPTHIVGYLKATTPHLSQLLTQLAKLGLPAKVYCPGRPVVPPPGFELSEAPLDLQKLLNPATLFVTNGGLTSVGLALQRRSRILLAPQQPEQVAMALRLHKLGLGTVALPERGVTATEQLLRPQPDRQTSPLQSAGAESRVLRCLHGDV